MLPIWEGTTNILSLDVLRAILKTNGEVITAFVSHCRYVLQSCGSSEPVTLLLHSLDRLVDYMAVQFPQIESNELRARELSFTIARIYIGTSFFNRVTPLVIIAGCFVWHISGTHNVINIYACQSAQFAYLWLNSMSSNAITVCPLLCSYIH